MGYDKEIAKMKKTARRIGVVLGLILLGIVVNALWEIVLKPILPSLRNFFLSMASMGIQSLRDNIYKNIAKGFNETPGLDSYTLITMLLCGFAILIFFLIIDMSREERKKISELTEEINNTEGASIESISKADPQKSLETLSKRSKRLLRDMWLSIPLCFFVIAVFAFHAIELTYINSAVTHYRQVLNICDPYLNDSDRKRIGSTFAQIRKKEHYIAVIKELENIATKKRQYVPKFEAW